jgi:hypothetical protein
MNSGEIQRVLARLLTRPKCSENEKQKRIGCPVLLSGSNINKRGFCILRALGVKGTPSLDTSPISSFPVRQLRKYGEARLQLKTECSLVLKQDRDRIDVRVNFNAFNDLALNLRKVGELPSAFLARLSCLKCSQCRLHEGHFAVPVELARSVVFYSFLAGVNATKIPSASYFASKKKEGVG